MPRAYSNIDVKRLIDDHQDLRKKLERVIALPNVYIDAIKAAADKLVASEVQIPIERSACSGGTAHPFRFKRRETPL